MARVGRYRYESKDFGLVVPEGSSATVQPVGNFRPSLLVYTVGRVDINSREVSTFFDAVLLWQPVLGLSIDDRIFVGAGIKFDRAVKEHPDGVDVFLRGSPLLA